ncbi:PREDICTED: cleavage and polyadenylation specificity factor subunit CG7185-like [Tarenaya hassleriana]|uniref:cleavage and polyadenylation specificity factor subunit CG7185-like n=1 Tax=Tarenaya hassleriana TaxID=28532 RepID=UPI00053C5F27|nr:PREDICTED: cleavage and polyadenylation specificity factor subunit CG7185-like [Tarenaya hassleriana]XP_010554164.1 PREDICTED: cleavage and polyadenylation specificity factor subunit CG7185-like [Tarenaya hassleriana]
MNPMSEENVDYGSNQKIHHQGSGTIPALVDEELMGEDDEYDDLYSDVNVGENFFQAHQPQTAAQGSGTGNGGLQAQRGNIAEPRMSAGPPSRSNVPGGSVEGKYQNDGGPMAVNGREIRSEFYPQASSVGSKALNDGAQTNKPVPQGSMSVVLNAPDLSRKTVNEPEPAQNSYGATPQASHQIPVNQMSGNPNANHALVNKGLIQPPPVENGNTMLFVGELHWWTTDAELESILSQYGRVKEIKFFDERASGKSKGYCQVEFYEAAAAAACKEGMNGYIFNGRACVVAFASPETLKQMGANFTGRNQGQNQLQNRRPLNEGMGRGNNMNMQSGGDGGGRNYGRGGFGRGGQGMNNRGGHWGGGAMRGRGMNNNMGGGNAAGIGNGPYGPGLAGHAFGGPAAGMMHPQGMMGAGFDPTFMGRGGGFGGFSGLAFPGMPPPFPGVNPVGMVGVAPHVNPAFFGRGMGATGMGMMGSMGMDASHAGMWNDASGYVGEDGGSEYGYEDENQEKDVKPNAAASSRDKERAPERDWTENSDRRHREEREHKGHRYHEERDGHRENRQRDRDSGYEDDWDRGQSSSKSRSRSRMGEDDHRSRSRDADYGKRRRSD